MSIERWELAQRQQGNVAGAEMAKVLRGQYGDVPLPSTQGVSREVPMLEIVRFAPEARKKLTEAGYSIHALTGRSIKTLKDAGKPFWSTWHKDHPELEAMGSRMSEVAVNPAQLFLPDSSGKTLAQQERMVEKFSQELAEKGKIEGVEAIIGQVPDYVELAFTHLDATGDRLFGQKYGYNYARTKTPTSGSSVADVGSFDADYGLFVDRWSRGGSNDVVFAAPLVVPKV